MAFELKRVGICLIVLFSLLISTAATVIAASHPNLEIEPSVVRVFDKVVFYYYAGTTSGAQQYSINTADLRCGRIPIKDDGVSPDVRASDGTFTGMCYNVNNTAASKDTIVEVLRNSAPLSPRVTAVVRIDNINPDSSIYINDNEQKTSSSDVSLLLSSSDEYALQGCRVSNENLNELRLLAHLENTPEPDNGESYNSAALSYQDAFRGRGAYLNPALSPMLIYYRYPVEDYGVYIGPGGLPPQELPIVAEAGNLDPVKGTLSFWIKTDTPAGTLFALGVVSPGTLTSTMELRKTATEIIFDVYDSALVKHTITAPIGSLFTPGFTMITVTWDTGRSPSQLAIYVNSQLAGLESESRWDANLAMAGNTMTFGSDPINRGRLNAVFDEIRIFGYPFSGDEIADSYNDFYSWEACASTKDWQLIDVDGVRNVYHESRDTAGNSQVSDDSIILDKGRDVTIIRPEDHARLCGKNEILAIAPPQIDYMRFSVDDIEIYTDTDPSDGWGLDYDFQTDGDFDVTVSAYEESGFFRQDRLVDSDTVSVTVDCTGPSFAISPIPAVVTGVFDISIISTDLVDIDYLTLEYSNNGVNYNYMGSFMRGAAFQMRYDSELMPNGVGYVVRAVGFDSLGNSRTVFSNKFEVSNVDIVEIYEPHDNDKICGRTNYKAIAGDDTIRMAFEFSGGPTGGITLYDGDPSDGWNVSVDLRFSARWLVRATAVTSDGPDDSDAIMVTVDCQGPVVTISPIPAVVSGAIPVSVSTSEPDFESVTLEYSLDKVQYYTITTLLNGSGMQFMFDTLHIDNGKPYVIRATARDDMGNTYVAYSNEFEILNYPTMLIIEPHEYETFCGAREIRVIAPGETDFVRFYVDGEAIGTDDTPADGFSFLYNFDESGKHQVMARAYKAGFIFSKLLAEDEITVTIDCTAPSFEFGSIDEYVAGTFTVSLVNVDQDTEHVLLEYSSDQVNYYYMATLTAGGGWRVPYDSRNMPDLAKYIIRGTAEDRYGNRKSVQSDSFTVDNTAPDVIIESPAEGQSVRGVVPVTMAVDDRVVGYDPATVSLRIDNRYVTPTPEGGKYRYSWDTSGLRGAHTLQGRAYDYLGNLGYSDEIIVNVDNELGESQLLCLPVLVRNTAVVKCTYQGEPAKTLVIDTTPIDSGGGFFPMAEVTPGSYEVLFTISEGNTRADGMYTLRVLTTKTTPYAGLASANLVLDNTLPDSSVSIYTRGAPYYREYNPNCTMDRDVLLNLEFGDANGIDMCRYTEEDITTRIFYARFDGTLRDEEGQLPEGSPAVTYVAGKYSEAVQIPENIAVSYDSDMLDYSEGTVTMWVQVQGNPDTKYTYYTSKSVGYDEGQVLVFSNKIIGLIMSDDYFTNVILRAQTDWNNGEWHHLAFSWEMVEGNLQVTLFADGEPVASGAAAGFIPPQAAAFAVGGRLDAQPTPGAIVDDFRTYSVAMDADGIKGRTMGLEGQWEECAHIRPWIVSEGAGRKYVTYEAKDNAQNIRARVASVYYDPSGTCMDMTPPTAPIVKDSGDFTNDSTRLNFTFKGYDYESELAHTALTYRYRLYNAAGIFVSPTILPEFADKNHDNIADSWQLDTKGLDVEYFFLSGSQNIRPQTDAGISVVFSKAVQPQLQKHYTFTFRASGSGDITAYASDQAGILGSKVITLTQSSQFYTLEFDTRLAEQVEIGFLIPSAQGASFAVSGPRLAIEGSPEWAYTEYEALALDNLYLKQAQYFLEVKAANAAQLLSESGFSDGILVDTIKPLVAVTSPTHPEQDRWYKSGEVTLEWSAFEEGSGVAGYSIAFDRYPETVPDAVVDTDASTMSYTATESEKYYFHIIAIDRAGNIGDAVTYNVSIDLEQGAPIVTIISPFFTTSHNPELWIRTNKRTSCLYAQQEPDAQEYAPMLSSDRINHKVRVWLEDGEYLYSYNCTDDFGYYNDTVLHTFLVDSDAKPDTVIIEGLKPSYYTGETVRVAAVATMEYGGVTYGLDGLERTTRVYLNNALIFADVQPEGSGRYAISFNAPEEPAEDVLLTVAVNDVANEPCIPEVGCVFDVVAAKLRVRYSGTIPDSQQEITGGNRIEYIRSPDFTFGLGANGEAAEGGDVEVVASIFEPVYIIMTLKDANLEERDRYMPYFMDLERPSFAFSVHKAEYQVATQLDYQDIAIEGDEKLGTGRYTIMIKNEGVGDDGKVRISIEVI